MLTMLLLALLASPLPGARAATALFACEDGAEEAAPYRGDAVGLAALVGADGVLRVSAEINAVGEDGLAPLAGLKATCGDLSVRGVKLTSLAGLDGLRTVHGRLAIEDVTGLLQLDSLGNINAVGSLSLARDPALRSTAGLSSLARVAGEAAFLDNPKLDRLDLPALREVGGTLMVRGLPAGDGPFALPSLLERVDGDLVLLGADDSTPGTTELSGAESLEAVGGRLILGGLPDLVTISAFGRLGRVGRDLTLAGLTRLENIDGFAQLQTIGGDLLLRCVPELQTLRGFRGLLSVRGGLVLVGTASTLDATALSPNLSLGSLYQPPWVEIDLAPGARPLAARVNVLSWFAGPVLGVDARHAASRSAPMSGRADGDPIFVAFAASGGGMRTGAFTLGVQRGLASLRADGKTPEGETTGDAAGSALGAVDLFSTVSGGGMAVGWLLGHNGALPTEYAPRDFRHRRLATLRPLFTSLRSLQSERTPKDGYQRMLGRWYGVRSNGDTLRMKDIWRDKVNADDWEPLWVPNATDLVGSQAMPITPAALAFSDVDGWWEGSRLHAPECTELGCDYGEMPLALGITASAGVPPIFPGTLLSTRDGQVMQGADGAFTDRFAANGALQAVWEIEQSGYRAIPGAWGVRAVMLMSYTRPDASCWSTQEGTLPTGTRTMERTLDHLRAKDDAARLDYLLGPQSNGVRPLYGTRAVLPVIQIVNLGPEILVHPVIWASLPDAGACQEAMEALYQQINCLPTDLTLPADDVQNLYDAGTMVAWLQQAVLRSALDISPDPGLMQRDDSRHALSPMLIPARFEEACGQVGTWRYEGAQRSAWESDEMR